MGGLKAFFHAAIRIPYSLLLRQISAINDRNCDNTSLAHHRILRTWKRKLLGELRQDSLFLRNTAMMLYDASGFRIDFPLKYLSDILKTCLLRFPCHSTRHTERLYFTHGGVGHRWTKKKLADEMVVAFTKRSNMVRTFVWVPKAFRMGSLC